MRTIVFILMTPLLLQSQIVYDGNAFIRKIIGSKVESKVQNNKLKFSVLEKVDLRTETRDIEFSKQEYALRFTPSSPAKIKAQRALEDLMNNYIDPEDVERLCTKRIAANKDWLALYISSRRQELYQSVLGILEDKSKILEKRHHILDFDLSEILDLESSISKIKYRIEEAASKKLEIIEKYNLSHVKFDFSNLIEVQEIKEKLQTDQLRIEVEAKDQYKQEKIQIEIELEKADKKQIVDFAQVKYQGPHNNIFSERYSFGLAFSLNTSGKKNLKIRELELEYQRNEARLKNKQEQKMEELEIQKNSILFNIDLLSQHQKIHSQERRKLNKLKTFLVREEAVNPDKLLSIQKRISEIEEDEIELLENILKDYLSYLSNKMELCLSNKNGLESLN